MNSIPKTPPEWSSYTPHFPHLEEIELGISNAFSKQQDSILEEMNRVLKPLGATVGSLPTPAGYLIYGDAGQCLVTEAGTEMLRPPKGKGAYTCAGVYGVKLSEYRDLYFILWQGFEMKGDKFTLEMFMQTRAVTHFPD